MWLSLGFREHARETLSVSSRGRTDLSEWAETLVTERSNAATEESYTAFIVADPTAPSS